MNQDKKINCLHFLHQPSRALLTTIDAKLMVLGLLSFFTKETIDSLEQFYVYQHLYQFDPHVGETSCQIRAYKILLLTLTANLPFIQSQIQTKIKNLKRIHSLIVEKRAELQTSKNKKELSKHQELETFLTQNGLIFDFDVDDLFIMQTYFLTRFKNTTASGSTYIAYDRMSEEMKTSRKLAKKITRHHQIMLAESSTKFIRELWKELPKEDNLAFVFNYLTYTDDNERTVLPCYLVMKILLSHIFYNSIPILFVIERQYANQKDHVCLLSVPSQINTFHVDHDHLKKVPCVVIRGVTVYSSATSYVETREQYIQRFTRHGLQNIILANLAYHPQYPGNKLRNLSFNPFEAFLMDASTISNRNINKSSILKSLSTELTEMKLFAKKNGCCKESSSLFFANHILCDTLENQMRLLKYDHISPHVILSPLSPQLPIINQTSLIELAA